MPGYRTLPHQRRGKPSRYGQSEYPYLTKPGHVRAVTAACRVPLMLRFHVSSGLIFTVPPRNRSGFPENV
jgi:hypothetical protein